jgi:hypothetical protein
MAAEGLRGRGAAALAPGRIARLLWRLVSQIGVLFVVLQAYTLLRKTFFQRPEAVAYANALDIIRWQGALGLNVELGIQRWVLERPALIDLFNAYYRQFKPALYLCAALALLLAPAGFRRVRRVFFLATLIALPWYALYPLAPPRFMGPYGYPFVDTLAAFSATPNATTGAAAANQFAAMPSMHIGWTSVAALWLAVALPRRRIGAILGGAHLAVMCLTVIATGNHYVLDIVAGLAVAGAAMALARLLPDDLGAPWRRLVARIGR